MPNAHTPSAAPRLIDLTATAALDAMRRGELTAEAYATALLDRAETRRDLNAFVTLERDTVLEQARAADQARAAGHATAKLHGLPIAVKDSVDTRMLPTSNGTRALRTFQPQAAAPMVERLTAAGALVLGKTNMTELSFGWTSHNGEFGPVRNPHDPDRIPGGSSGGSAAAVAARIAPLAIAADTLGSIRVPAAMCGVAGLRPTFDRYPRAGIFSLTQDKLDQAGPLARSVADLALFDAVQTGDATPLEPIALEGVRIGIAPFYQAGLDREIERVMHDGYRRLRDAGAVLVEADVPDAMQAAFEIAATIMLYETLPSITAFLQAQGAGLTFERLFEQVSPEMQAFLSSVALPPNRPPQESYEAMLVKRAQLQDATRRHFAAQNIAALAFPALAAFPARIGQDGEVEINGVSVSFFDAYGRNTALSPVAATPALVLPAGMSSQGLPVALEFNALPGQDRQLLALGLSIERALGSIPVPAI